MLGGRRENGRGGLLGRALDPVVGLGAEAIAHHRAKSKSPDSATPHTTATPSSSPYPSGEPSNAGHVSEPGLPAYRSSGLSAATADRKPASLESHGEDDADTESDEEQWTLDDAAQEVAAPHGTTGGNAATVPKGNIAAPASVDSLVHSFVKQHPPGGPNAGSALAVPVILPQRRPMDSKRGFVRAYAPLLHDCGISQETWFDFLYSFDESIKVQFKISPIFDVINVAATGCHFIPSPAAQIASISVAAADELAKRTYGRYRNNDFLAKINAAYFRPQGLCCIVMTYHPASSDSPVETFDLQSTVAKAVQGPDAQWARKFKTAMAPSQGKIVGAQQMPATAPLVHPQLDRAPESAKAGFWKRGSAFVADYFDRRAQAAHHDDDPGNSLAARPRFESSLGDPGSGVQSHMDRSLIEQRLNRRRAKREARRAHGPGGYVRRSLKSNVLYMMVARIPTDDELSAARQALEVLD